MKKILWSMAALSLMMAGCSKDEIEESVTEGVSAVATPVGSGLARLSGDGPDIWFNDGQGNMWAQFTGGIGTLPQNCNPHVRLTFGSSTPNSGDATGHFDLWDGQDNLTVMEADLCRIGNSRNYRSANNTFRFSDDQYFSLVDLELGWRMANGMPGEYSAKLFLYPSGRTVVQDPKVVKVREHGEGRIVATIADDPAQDVASLDLHYGDGIITFEKTHFNQALGLSRWVGVDPRNLSGPGTEAELGKLYLRNRDKYDTGFVGGETNAVQRIIKAYEILSSDGGIVFTESNDPVMLGSGFTSPNNGGTYTLTLAIADLGNRIETSRLTFLPSEYPMPVADTYQMQLVGEGEGKLKVYEVEGIRFSGPVPDDATYSARFTFGPCTNCVFVIERIKK